ncbi:MULTISPECIES: hypothetical protein [Rhodococcus]|uniref:hypothetical protein n=1 Tax=Rhodococcus TaxID=1827 RepID=UPI000B0C67F4|nr:MULTISPECIES: hypothetical protein [Rhodococcus]MBX4171564.1 hypothetical protein [Rhodococcus sp. DMU2021]QQM53393.1 hypothetical protein JGU70_01060 [Rhodococcus pyridinivorans]
MAGVAQPLVQFRHRLYLHLLRLAEPCTGDERAEGSPSVVVEAERASKEVQAGRHR